MKLLRPRNLDEALNMLRQDAPATPIAGGTDLMVSWHHRSHDDLTLLDLSSLRDLSTMKLNKDMLELGALTTYWQIMQSPNVREAFPLLHDAARQVGAVQIQTRGTWAGNIGNGSPAADGVPVMMAYDAAVELTSARGRREVRLDAYYTGYRQSVRAPDELITAIRLPRRQRTMEWFHKVGARAAQAITKVGVAVVHDDAGWRVVANSVAPTVVRCRHMEAALSAGQRFGDPQAVEQIVAKDVSPIDDLRSTAAYRRRVLARLLYYRLSMGDS